MKLEEQIMNLENQRNDLKKEVEERTKKIYQDRSSYEIALILESTKETLGKEYLALEFRIETDQKTKEI